MHVHTHIYMQDDHPPLASIPALHRWAFRLMAKNPRVKEFLTNDPQETGIIWIESLKYLECKEWLQFEKNNP